jgi:hypothetical protein
VAVVFNGSITFGGSTLASSGEDPDAVHAIAVDSVGNVVLTGRFQGTIDFGGGPLVSEGDDDLFVAKLDAEGKHLWSRRYGNDKTQWGAAVAASGSDEVFLGGFFKGSVDFGGGALTAQSFDTNLFIAKLRTP